MKFRIIQNRCNDETTGYNPQYKYDWFPMWFYYKCSYTGYDWSEVTFKTYEEALKYIDHIKKDRAKKFTKIIHNLGDN